MMNMKHKYLLIACLGMLLFGGCHEKEYYREPFVKGDKIPGAVTKVHVDNFPGGAKIVYQIPDDPGFWYVEADFKRNGKQVKVRSSSYNNYIIVDGFGDSSKHTVKLYSVNRSLNKSKPVAVGVKPLTPPIYKVFNSLSIGNTFGGVYVNFKNKDSANIALIVLTKDSLNEWVNAGDIYHTSRKEGSFSVRGYDSTERTFGVYVRDRWGNLSDTLVGDFKPLFEQELDKSLFRVVNLPTDYNKPNLGHQIEAHAWNGSLSENDFTTEPGHGLPQWFTFDLGVKARLSRLVVWTRQSSRFLYNSGAVKKWQIWGSNDPNTDGSWDSWQLLLTCTAVKPSGLPAGQNTAEDLAAVKAGWEFTFPLNTPPVRYIRWKTLANWGNVSHITITEITLYGQVQ